jgi:ABC-type phosphate transport system substrate-binding protein
MHQQRWPILFALAAGFAVCGAPIGRLALSQSPNEIVVVVNKANKSADGLNRFIAKRVLLGGMRNWVNGNKITVVLPPAGNPDRAAVLKSLAGMNESEFTRFQLQASFTGGSPTDIHEASAAAAAAYIRANAGSIGFLRRSEVNDSVKVILVLD